MGMRLWPAPSRATLLAERARFVNPARAATEAFMQNLVTLAQALGVAYASGISVYATVALLGIAQRMEWISPLPGSLSGVGSVWVIGIAGTLYAFEMLAT